MPCTVFIKGIPQLPDVAARNAPGVKGTTVLFRPKVGTQATCTDVKPDPDGDNYQGQLYKWFNLTFPDGTTGWVRDDLLDLQGDCTSVGYGNYSARTFAFTALNPAAASTTTPASSSAAPAATAPASTAPTSSQPASTTAASSAPAATADSSMQQTAQPDKTFVEPTSVKITAPPGSTVTATITTPSSGGNSCAASVRSDVRAKLRAGPSTATAQNGVLDGGTAVTIKQVVKGQDNDSFRWIHTNVNGVDGYVREDLLNYSGDCSAFGLSSIPATSGATTGTTTSTPSTSPAPSPAPTGSIGLWPPPLQRNSYRVFQEYLGTLFGRPHKGTDLTETAGAQITASGSGVVAWVMRCTRCTDSQPSFNSQGVQSWDVNAINDPAWGYGFGNHVVVRYAYNVLPDTMRQAMDQANLTGGYVYVIHAHMERIDIAAGTAVQAGTPLGLLGTTGNSTGPHVHVEVRADKSPNLTKTSDVYNRAVFNPRLIYDI